MYKLLNRILSVCLMVTLFVSSAAVVYADDEITEFKPSDELVALQKLGILPEELTESGDCITRAQAVSYVADALGSLQTEAAQIFTDVSDDSEYFKSIYSAYISGVIKGTGDRKFEPDEKITYEQLQKFAVDVLGYENAAFYVTYDKISRDLGLFRNTAAKYGDSITYADYVQVVYNMFHAKYAVVSNIERGSVSYKSSGKILLNLLGIYVDEGILTEKDEFSMKGVPHRNGYVTIGGISYKSDVRHDDIRLGTNVKVYYKYDGDEEILLHLYEYDNDIYEIDKDDIKSVSKTEFTYYTGIGSRTDTLYISKTASILQNGAQMSPFNPDALKKADGNVYLVDNDKDGEIDCVLYQKAVTCFVAGARSNGRERVLTDKRGIASIDLSKYDTVRVIRGGSEIDFADIASNSIATVYESDYSAEVYVSTVSMGAYIQQSSEDEYTINDTVYKCIDSYEENRKKGYGFTPELKAGVSAMFYIDYKGRIAAADVSGYDGRQYGVLVAVNENRGLSDNVMLRLFNDGGTMKDYETEDKISYNGKKITAQSAMDNFKTSFENSTFKSKAVKYTVNSEGNISEIVNCYSDDENAKITLNHVYSTNAYWRAESRTFCDRADEDSGVGSSRYGMAPGGKIISVPSSLCTQFSEKFEEDDFDIITVTDLSNSTNCSGTQIYDADEAHGAKLALAYVPTSEKFSSVSEFLCVNDITKVSSDDETESVVVTGLWQKKEASFEVVADEYYAEIKKGDIIHPLFDEKDRIKSFKIVFRFGDKRPVNGYVYNRGDGTDTGEDTHLTQYSAKHDMLLVFAEGSSRSKLYNTCTTLYGNLLGLNANGFTATYNDSPSELIAFYNIPGYIIVCEDTRNGREYRLGKFSELFESGKDAADGSEILLNLRNSRVTQIFMFK